MQVVLWSPKSLKFAHEFAAHTLHLYLTEGAANEWREAGAFPLFI